MRLKDRVAIITGAGRGIGKAMAVKFAAEGASVVVADINIERATETATQIRAAGGYAEAVRTDVTNASSIAKMVKHTLECHGKIDILVNNAGILSSTAFEDITEREWDAVIDTNLKSVFLCCQAVIGNMQANHFGRIINMSSNAGRDGGIKTSLAYSASKAGVIGFTRGLAKRMAAFGITCNSIAPGTTNSEMLMNFTPEMIESLKAGIPVGRLGEPEDYAELACLICSDTGSFMTGAVIDINGGLFIG